MPRENYIKALKGVFKTLSSRVKYKLAVIMFEGNIYGGRCGIHEF